MKTYFKPEQTQWAELTKRPVINKQQLTQAVSSIVNDVQQNGDTALIKYASMFDGVNLASIEVTNTEIQKAIEQTPQELKDAIAIAYNNISTFHKAQQVNEQKVETN